MTLSDFYVYTVIAESPNMAAAAKKLHLTRSAVTHAITRIENELSFPLLYRGGQQWRLTEEAEELLPYAYEVLQSAGHFQEHVSGIQRLSRGSVSLATCSSTCVAWVPDILNRFKEKHPNITVNIQSGLHNHQIIKWIENCEIDLGIAAAAPSDVLEITNLYRDEMKVIVNRAFSSQREGVITADELKNMPLVLQMGRMKEDATHTLTKLGLEAHSQNRAYDAISLVAMVEGGLGYCVMGNLVLKSLVEKMSGIHVYSLDPPQYRYISLIRNQKIRPSPAARAFSREIIQYIRENAEEGCSLL